MKGIRREVEKLEMETLPTRVLVVRAHLPQVKALSAAGMEVTVLWDERTAWRIRDEIIDSGEIQLVRWERGRVPGLDPVRLAVMVVDVVSEKGIEVVHVNALRDLASVFLAARMLTPGRVRPVIVAMGRNPRSWKRPRTAWLASRLIMHLCGGFVALSSVHCRQLVSLGVPEHRLTVIPNPYDRDWLERCWARGQRGIASRQRIRVVYVATLCPRKAQDILVRAAAVLAADHENVEFVLIGEDGQEDEYRKSLLSLIDSLRLDGRVILAGQVPHTEVGKQVLRSDIVAFPTRAEMMPRALIEAMTLGKPVVASGVDGILDLIEHEKTGLLVPAGDVGKLARGIRRLIEEPVLAAELARAGQAFAREYCDPERVGWMFRRFYARMGQRE